MDIIIDLETSSITDWESFHDVFKRQMGFPEFYGRNMNAWIDCMSSLDEPGDGMSQIQVPQGGSLVLSLSDASQFSKKCPDQYDAIVECSAFVNKRRIDAGESPLLFLAF